MKLWRVVVRLNAHRAAVFHAVAGNRYEAIDRVMKLRPALTGKACVVDEVAEQVVAV